MQEKREQLLLFLKENYKNIFLLVFSYFSFTSYYHHSFISLNLKFVNNTGRKFLIKKKEFIGTGQQYSSH